MNVQEKRAFGVALGVLATNFRADLTDAQIGLLWLALKDDLTLAQFERAAARALRELEFFPSVGKLLELAGRGRRGPAGKIQVIDGKPYTWLEGTGWGRYHGSIRGAARSVGIDPEAAKDILGRLDSMKPPPALDRRPPREKEDNDGDEK